MRSTFPPRSPSSVIAIGPFPLPDPNRVAPASQEYSPTYCPGTQPESPPPPRNSRSPPHAESTQAAQANDAHRLTRRHYGAKRIARPHGRSHVEGRAGLDAAAADFGTDSRGPTQDPLARSSRANGLPSRATVMRQSRFGMRPFRLGWAGVTCLAAATLPAGCGGGAPEGGFLPGPPGATTPSGTAHSGGAGSDDAGAPPADVGDAGPPGLLVTADAGTAARTPDCRPGTYAGPFTTNVSFDADAGGLFGLFASLFQYPW